MVTEGFCAANMKGLRVVGEPLYPVLDRERARIQEEERRARGGDTPEDVIRELERDEAARQLLLQYQDAVMELDQQRQQGQTELARRAEEVARIERELAEAVKRVEVRTCPDTASIAQSMPSLTHSRGADYRSVSQTGLACRRRPTRWRRRRA